MRVVSIPKRLRLAALVLALSVPLAGIDAVLASRAPWWRLPYRSAGIAMCAATLTLIPLLYGMLRGKRWTVFAVQVVGIAWSLYAVFSAMHLQEPLLGLFAVLSMGYWLGVSMWLDHEMDRSFFNPRIRWFQRIPKPIPGLECRFSLDASKSGMRVSRIDEDGVFIYSESSSNTLKVAHGKSAEFLLSYRDRQVRCHGFPVVVLPLDAGYGLQFGGMSADEQKTLGDFVEILRGEGHV